MKRQSDSKEGPVEKVARIEAKENGNEHAGCTGTNGSSTVVTTGSLQSNGRPSSSIVGISRTIAACQRCRQKKTKCDQQFPSCARCLKAGVACVGLDPATGRQVPRSYVISLEDRIGHLEALLKQHGIDPNGSINEDGAVFPSSNHSSPQINHSPVSVASNNSGMSQPPKDSIGTSVKLAVPSNNSKDLSFYIGDSSGISFAKLLFTAVNFHPGSITENNSITTRVPTAKDGTQQITTSLPNKQMAEYLIKCYFEQSNTQLPIVHREHFINHYFKPVYGNLSADLKLASNYTKMNLDTSPIADEDTWYHQYQKKKLQAYEASEVPTEFHQPLFFLHMIFAISSSINLLNYDPETSNSYRLQAMIFVESIYSAEDRLVCLQGLLFMTLFSIMRPSNPGVWYILGTSLRLCVDLGLHTEKLNSQFSPFVKDMRRRLFWCAYSLDRQVCVYLGRPFGIPEESVSTKFPVELDDCLINEDETQDFTGASNSLPTYKTISLNFFKIRRIQAEILEVLYFSSSTLPRFYNNLNDWKQKIDNQLEHWFRAIPLKTSRKCNCDFNFEFFKLNYHHTKMLLFGVTPKNSKPTNNTLRVIFDSSKGIIDCYAELLKSKTVNYTWSAVHNLFMAGTSFFYAIYTSRDNLITVEEFQRQSRTVIDVLTSLVQSCEAASPCVEIFEILTLAMIRMKFENADHSNIVTHTDLDDIDKFFEQLNQKTPSEHGDIFKDLKQPTPINPMNTIRMLQQHHHQQQQQSQTPQEWQHSISRNQRSIAGSPESSSDGQYPSLSTPPLNSYGGNGHITQDFEQQRIFELMNQISSDTIYKQMFGGQDFMGTGI